MIASHNPGKVVEISDLLAPFGAEVVSVAELGQAGKLPSTLDAMHLKGFWGRLSLP